MYVSPQQITLNQRQRLVTVKISPESDMTSGEHNLHYFEWYRAFEYLCTITRQTERRTEDRKGNSRQALLILYSGLTHSSEFLMCCLALAISAISELLESSSVVDWLGSNCPQLVKKLRGRKREKQTKVSYYCKRSQYYFVVVWFKTKNKRSALGSFVVSKVCVREIKRGSSSNNVSSTSADVSISSFS